MMSKIQDTEYLLQEQYHNADNLNARITLHKRFSTNQYGWFKWVFDHFTFESNVKILELGCGPGDLWKKNYHRIPPDWDITLSDFSAGMVSHARNRLNEKSKRFSFNVIDVQAIPYMAEKFHVVIANHFLYHVPSRQKAFSEIQRVLKPGGLFYATTIGEGHLEEISNLIEKFEPTLEDVFKSVERPFTLENGIKQLQDWFGMVALNLYTDSLRVTEVKPLAAYLLSTVRYEQIQNKRKSLITFLEEEMAANDGEICIKKVSGLFIGKK